jgi:peptide/nickel transport system permease protein
MLTYISRRVLYSIPIILIASFLLFWFVRATFDPTAHLHTSHTAARAIAEERRRLGLNQPVAVQWFDWLKQAVQGNLGKSELKRQNVSTMISDAFPNTLQLIFWGVLLSAIAAIVLGVYSAVHQYSKADYTFTGLAFIGISMPPFWFALIAIQFFAVDPQNWFHLNQPIFKTIGLHSAGMSGINLDYFSHLVLPVLTLTVQIIAEWSRFQRASMLDVMSSDYIRTARAKGVPRRRVVYHHALRNALIPLVTVMALDIGLLFGGIIVTEKIFSIPGMGTLFLDALSAGDAPVLVGWMIVSAVFIVAFNLIADILYGVLDPRIRLS